MILCIQYSARCNDACNINVKLNIKVSYLRLLLKSGSDLLDENEIA